MGMNWSGETDSPAGPCMRKQHFVMLARVAGEADHRLEIQHELVLAQGFADALHPGLDQVLLGAVAGGGIEDLDAVAADALGRLQALAGLGQ